MPRHSFHTLNVFTDHRFGGNPLAVFDDIDGIDAATMQRLAADMNLSETSFVLPPEAPFTVHQGVQMGRPSLLHIAAHRAPDGIRATVGGHCVPMFTGWWDDHTDG